ncbi:MAG: hypothetical protein HQ512_14285 [Rhodospirillales bacterium]|nr:hypothetical protein [Rhodospirillales bacterium]
MTAVFSVLSFFMAFGAIWLTSEALRRIDTRNDAMVKPHLRKIYAAVDKNEETLLALKRRMDQVEKQVHTLKLRADLPPEIEQETAVIRSGLNNQERFSPSIRLNG